MTHESPTSFFEGFIDEFGDFGEMQSDVGLGDVQELESLVLDAPWRVEVLVGVHQADPLALGGIKNVRHPDLL